MKWDKKRIEDFEKRCDDLTKENVAIEKVRLSFHLPQLLLTQQRMNVDRPKLSECCSLQRATCGPICQRGGAQKIKSTRAVHYTAQCRLSIQHKMRNSSYGIVNSVLKFSRFHNRDNLLDADKPPFGSNCACMFNVARNATIIIFQNFSWTSFL